MGRARSSDGTESGRELMHIEQQLEKSAPRSGMKTECGQRRSIGGPGGMFASEASMADIIAESVRESNIERNLTAIAKRGAA